MPTDSCPTPTSRWRALVYLRCLPALLAAALAAGCVPVGGGGGGDEMPPVSIDAMNTDGGAQDATADDARPDSADTPPMRPDDGIVEIDGGAGGGGGSVDIDGGAGGAGGIDIDGGAGGAGGIGGHGGFDAGDDAGPREPDAGWDGDVDAAIADGGADSGEDDRGVEPCPDADGDETCDADDSRCEADGIELACNVEVDPCPPGAVPEVRGGCFTGRCLTWAECGGDVCLDADRDGVCDVDDARCERDGAEVACGHPPVDCPAGAVPEYTIGCGTGRCMSWAACSREVDVPDVPDVPCAPGRVWCDGACADTGTTLEHCGACGFDCFGLARVIGGLSLGDQSRLTNIPTGCVDGRCVFNVTREWPARQSRSVTSCEEICRMRSMVCQPEPAQLRTCRSRIAGNVPLADPGLGQGCLVTFEHLEHDDATAALVERCDTPIRGGVGAVEVRDVNCNCASVAEPGPVLDGQIEGPGDTRVLLPYGGSLYLSYVGRIRRVMRLEIRDAAGRCVPGMRIQVRNDDDDLIASERRDADGCARLVWNDTFWGAQVRVANYTNTPVVNGTLSIRVAEQD